MLDQQQLNSLFRYCLSFCKQEDDAFDLLQTGLEKYLKHKTEKPPLNLPYIRQIIRNHFVDEWRKTQPYSFDSFEDDDEVAVIALETLSLDSIVINDNLIDDIWERLNFAEREILYFWALEGYTAAEIAIELNMPRGTILSKIHRLRQKVVAFMQHIDDQYAPGGESA